MSKRNVEVVRRAYEAWRQGDSQSVIESVDESMEWDWSAYPLPDVAERGKGRENYLGFLAEFSSSWAEHEVAVTELIDAGNSVVVAIHERMKASGGELALERDIAHTCDIRDGRIAMVRAYKSKEEALEAAGTSELEA